MGIIITDLVKELPRHSVKKYQVRTIEDIDLIVLHHAGPNTENQGAFEFARFHVNSRGWPGCGYHYVIRSNGIIEKANPVTRVSYHATGFNTRGIGICLSGNNDNHPMTRAQHDALLGLVGELRKAYPGIKYFAGHRELPDVTKTCPGLKVDLGTLRQKLGFPRATPKL